MQLGHDHSPSKVLSPPRCRPLFPSWVFGLFIAAVLLVAFLRLFYGVDFVDEATYVAVPYRFCLGDTPFVDEHTPIQTSGLLSLPFIALFHAIRGDAEGLVLYTRALYFLLCCGVATVVAFGLKPWIGLRSAVMVALVCVVFCPLGIPNLSYNTWSSGFFTIGIFLGLQHLLWKRSTRWLFMAGVAHGLCALALPSYVAPNLCYALVLWCLLEPASRLRGVLLYAAGGVTALIPFAGWLVRFDGETLSNAYSHAHAHMSEGWMLRVRQFANQISWFVPIKLELSLALAALAVAIRYRIAWLAALLFSVLPLFPLIIKKPTNALWYVAVIAACGTLFLLLSWRAHYSKRILWSVWFPSLCAAAMTSLTSLNGLVISGLGLLPIALMGISMAVVLFREATEGSSLPLLKRLDLVFPTLVIAVLVGYQRRPFGEDVVAELTTRVSSGPYKGMFTSAEKAEYLSSITADLTELARDHDRILFINHFPAGYLITQMRPAASCIWTYPCTGGPIDDCTQAMRRDLARSEGPGFAVFRMHRFPLRIHNDWTCDLDPEIDSILEKRFDRALDRPGYTVFVGR